MASSDYSIKDIEKVVKFDGTVKNVEVSRLTAPGENFLSLVLRVDFELEKNGHSKTITSVAKCLPLTANKKGEFNFRGHVMGNEIKFYSEIVPLFKDFAKEYDIKMEIFPEFYGSRYSLDASKQKADSDSVILLENLIPQGYINDDRYIGCDLNTSKAILKNLAVFHALPIAIKVKKPELFQIIKDFLDSTHPKPPENDSSGPDGKKKEFGPPPGAETPEDVLCEELLKISKCVSFVPKIKTLLQHQHLGPITFDIVTKEPWNTMIHSDFWVNNVMSNTASEKSPLVKIVDFQMCTYGSFAKDLVFFLLTSVRNDVAVESLDDLLRLYYDEFTSILQKTDTNLELTYEDYLEEVRMAARESEVTHALLFSTIIFGEKGTGIDAAVEEFDPTKYMISVLRNMNQYHKDKLFFVANEATKRDWIKSF